ncbi:MAG: ATP-binding protein [Firmicutes bacterium]|nr:ATP-binding protein [Bacillota bacterium]
MSIPIQPKIWHEYDEKRRQAESDAAFRRMEVYQKIPRIREIDQALEQTGISAVRAYLQSPEKSKEELLLELKKNNQKLRNEKKELLLEAQIPENYADPVYQCPYCKDTGFVDGKRCRCLVQRLIDDAYEASGIREELMRNNFQTFNIGLFSRNVLEGQKVSPRKNMANVSKMAYAFAEQFPNNEPHSMIFYGGPGTGKTFLCDCIAKMILDRGFTVLYLTANQLCSAMEEYRFHRNAEMQDKAQLIHDQISEVDLLIIDDLGSEYLNQVTAADLFECFNQRILKNKATLVSTNLEPERLRSLYMDRLYSRFKGYYQFVPFFGPDLRTINR